MPTDQAGYIAPERIYTRQHFLAAMGLGLSTVRKHARAGNPLPVLAVGQQLYVEGHRGIEWLRTIAEQQAGDTTCKPEPVEATQADDGEFGHLSPVEYSPRLEAAS